MRRREIYIIWPLSSRVVFLAYKRKVDSIGRGSIRFEHWKQSATHVYTNIKLVSVVLNADVNPWTVWHNRSFVFGIRNTKRPPGRL